MAQVLVQRIKPLDDVPVEDRRAIVRLVEGMLLDELHKNSSEIMKETKSHLENCGYLPSED